MTTAQDSQAQRISEFRQQVRLNWPHVRVSVRTISFEGLARCSRKCLTMDGERSIKEAMAINQLARQAGIVPDRGAKYYGDQA